MLSIAVLSGAGISAESGIKTFRDADGLWEGHDVLEVASPEGWKANPELVNNFYNLRRQQLKQVKPNIAHEFFASLEQDHQVHIVTQNVDDLHERAGSTNVMHLHGELNKVRSTGDASLVYPWTEDLQLGDTCEKGFQLRPHIVWFGEEVPLLHHASQLVASSDICIVIGTSLQVYPAAGLMHFAPDKAQIIYVDPHPAAISTDRSIIVIEKKATASLGELAACISNFNQ